MVLPTPPYFHHSPTRTPTCFSPAQHQPVEMSHPSANRTSDWSFSVNAGLISGEGNNMEIFPREVCIFGLNIVKDKISLGYMDFFGYSL